MNNGAIDWNTLPCIMHDVLWIVRTWLNDFADLVLNFIIWPPGDVENKISNGTSHLTTLIYMNFRWIYNAHELPVHLCNEGVSIPRKFIHIDCKYVYIN